MIVLSILIIIFILNNLLFGQCRYVVEKQNGFLKNCKALENIRNTVLGHIHIDYRIACAMSNFDHKPCNADGKDARKIAKKIRERAKISVNHLNVVLKKHLDTAHMGKIELNSISDFPKLKINQMKNKIFYGTYQLRQCESYVGDLVKSGQAFLATHKAVTSFFSKENCFRQDLLQGKTKLLAVEIASRHKRGQVSLKQNASDESDSEEDLQKNTNSSKKLKFRTMYKVFIVYEPNVNNPEAIHGKYILLVFELEFTND